MPRLLGISALALSVLAMSSSTAVGLVPRVAICGRVTSFIDAPTPGDDIVRLGSQEPRRLSLGSQIPQLGQEICIWGTDVENMNPPASDPAPKGIVGYAIAPAASVGCADMVTATSANFVMPGEGSPLPNAATITLPLSKPAEGGCVRIAVDAAGNPVAVVVPRGVSPSAAVSPPPVRPGVPSLPSTSAGDDRVLLAVGAVAAAFFAAAIFLIVRRRRRRAIPS